MADYPIEAYREALLDTRRALERVWAELTPEQVRELDPDLVRTAQDVHNLLSHPEEPKPEGIIE